MTDELRAKFEAAFPHLDFSADSYGNYYSQRTLDHLYGYQAGHASRDAEVEALKRDAERYRWLSARTCVEDRDGGWSSSYHFYPVARHSDSTYKGSKPFHYGTLNEAIDAAMREGK